MEARPGEKGRVPEFAHIWGEEGNLGELEAWGGVPVGLGGLQEVTFNGGRRCMGSRKPPAQVLAYTSDSPGEL